MRAAVFGSLLSLGLFVFALTIGGVLFVRSAGSSDISTLAGKYGHLLELWFLGSMAVALITGGALAGYMCREAWRKGASATGLALACLFATAIVASSQTLFDPPRIVLCIATFWVPLMGGYLGSELARRRKAVPPHPGTLG